MSFIRRHTRFLLVGVSCAALGAAASVLATAGAASTGSASTGSGQTVAAGKTKALRMRPLRAQRLRRVAMRAVHGTVVVQTKKGFADVTFDRGKVDSVNGQHLTLTEGSKVARYRTVTLTIPAGAAVRDDRQPASLSSVKAGQRVLVVVAPSRTYVIAHTPKSG